MYQIPAKHLLVDMTATLQERIDARPVGETFRLKDLLAAEWATIDNKPGLDAIFARYVDRGGRFVNVEALPGNIAGSRHYRRIDEFGTE
ncbi:MAG: hypothetical protein AAFZ09_06625 [Pseudomonadota bacterium]